MGGVTFWLTVSTAILAGVVGGVLFAFSSFVMPALARLAPAEGVAAMQAINRAAVEPTFMVVLFVPAASSIGLAVVALRSWDQRPAPWLLAGAVLYLAGIALTILFHVPRNDALALLDPTAVSSVGAWADYLSAWTAGNHVRAFTSVAAAACLTWAVHLA